MISFRATYLVTIVSLLVVSCADDSTQPDESAAARSDAVSTTISVSGSGIDYQTTAIIHSQDFTDTQLIQKSTETVDLDGDLHGRVLYHVTTVIDFVANTLVNTGDQVYSGTVAGSAPALIHDDKFRFDVDFNTGVETGKVYLDDNITGPKVRCYLDVVGTGATAEGNPTFDYTGTCEFRSE